MVSTKALGSDIEYPLRSNALSAKSVLGGRVALTHRCIDKGEGSFTLSNHDEMCWTLGVASDQLPKVCLGSP